MSVHERSWTSYDGRLTEPRWRWLILPRYAYREVFKSRIFTGLVAAAFILPVVGAVVIYLRHNLSILGQFKIDAKNFFIIDSMFFLYFLSIQSFFGFLISFILGPALISPDLVNGALPLYLARPFSRTEYLLGKFSVLAILLSAVTWLPALLLYSLEGSLEKNAWFSSHLRILAGAFAGSWLLIISMALLAMALSAAVRSRAVARVLMVWVLFLGAGVGNAINAIAETKWGSLLVPVDVMRSVWIALLGDDSHAPLPFAPSLAAMIAIWLLSLALIHRKLRAFEVVR